MDLSRHQAYMRRRAARRASQEDMRPHDDAPTSAEDAALAHLPPIAPQTRDPAEPGPSVDPEPQTEPDSVPTPDPVSEPEPEPEPQPLQTPDPSPSVEPVAEPEDSHREDETPSPATVAAPEPKSGLDDTDTDSSLWSELRQLALDPDHFARHLLISALREDPAHVAFDVLRTKLMSALRARGWSRVAITSPTPDCGKSFVAANLAISLSRQAGRRILLMDMDLRRPSLAKAFGASGAGAMADLLRGKIDAADLLVRPAPNTMNIGETLALGLNGRAEAYAAELLHAPHTSAVLQEMYGALDPDIVLFDMPPALYHDDVIGFRAEFDGILLVIAGGRTTAQQVRDVKARFGADTPLLGVVMNRAEGESIAEYEY